MNVPILGMKEQQQPFMIILIVTVTLALVVLSALIGGLVLATQGKNVPDFVIALGAGAAGTLSGILIPRTQQ